MPNFIEIGGVTRKFSKKLVDLTWNDPNGIEVLTPIVIAHAKDHSDVDQMLTRNQIMEYASKDNYDDLCVDSAHIDSLLPLLQGMHY